MTTGVSRSAIEQALAELITYQQGFKFQSIAVTLAKRRWPELVACEWGHDLGRDAYAPAATSPDARGKVVAASLTATLAKVKDDAAKNKKYADDVSLLVFVTPRPLTNDATRAWAEEIRSAYGYELLVIPREDLINELLHPENGWICREWRGRISTDRSRTGQP